MIKKGPSRGARHGNTERKPIYHATHVTARTRQKREDIIPSCIDFKDARFTESDSSRLDGMKTSAHTRTMSQMKTIDFGTLQLNINDLKKVG